MAVLGFERMRVSVRCFGWWMLWMTSMMTFEDVHSKHRIQQSRMMAIGLDSTLALASLDLEYLLTTAA